ncbi:unnamed protein product [Tuber aestivum]|uniref:Uncharacterized protein n=1 Tax=Tuber aestivum TaxID=59557 RepID=A0A292PNG3_9PEZI|nr:unnamed protein product [Tuber aestivum]
MANLEVIHTNDPWKLNLLTQERRTIIAEETVSQSSRVPMNTSMMGTTASLLPLRGIKGKLADPNSSYTHYKQVNVNNRSGSEAIPPIAEQGAFRELHPFDRPMGQSTLSTCSLEVLYSASAVRINYYIQLYALGDREEYIVTPPSPGSEKVPEQEETKDIPSRRPSKARNTVKGILTAKEARLAIERSRRNNSFQPRIP